MRFLELKTDEGEAIELHPKITVVRGLGDDQRRWLVGSVGRLGSAPAEGSGIVEASGVIFDLTDETLELLDLEGEHDAVISPQTLGAPEVADAANTAAAEASAAAGAAGLDDSATADAAVGTADIVQTDAPPPATTDTPLGRRLVALQSRRDELSGLAESIEVAESSQVQEALDVLDAVPATQPDPTALALADAWRDLVIDKKGIELGTTPEERAALVDVNAAQEAVAAAEAVLRQPQLSREQARRIEAAHAAVTDASDKVDRRFGGNRARKQLADAEAEEQRLLQRFGFGSWVDYMLNTSRRASDPEMTNEKAALEEARKELEACIAELDAVPGAVGRRHRRNRLREREDELSSQVAEVLGHEPVGDGVEAELRAITTTADRTEHVAALADALEGAGLDPAPDPSDAERVIAAARHFLAGSSHARHRRGELEAAVSAIDVAVSELEAARAEGATEVPDMAPLPDMAEPPKGLLEMLGLDPEDNEDTDESDDPEESAQPELDLGIDPAPVVPVEIGSGATDGAATGDDDAGWAPPVEPGDASEVEGIEALFDADDLPAALRPGGPDRAKVVDDVHWSALERIAAARTDGPGGHRPVVFDDPFELLEADECIQVLGRLARLTDLVQVVVVTDRPEVADWARAIGPDHAAVVG